MRTHLIILGLLIAGVAQADIRHEAWQVRHQPDRFVDRVLMEAFADADKGPARLSLFCDTENGFRVMLMPHQALMPEGPAQVSFRIDGGAAVTLSGNAFGDDTTDVVTVYDTASIQPALAAARHVTIHYAGAGGASGELGFTFDGLAAGKPEVMKICPVGQPRPR
jgi:hypothetical protein